MGYFFRPFIYSIVGSNTKLMKEFDKQMKFGKRYRLEWRAKKEDGTYYQDPMWRSWGCFSETKHYKEFMNKIFDVKNDDYNIPLYTRKFEGNKDYHTDIEIIKLCKEFKKLLETDPEIQPWTWKDEKPKLVYILKGPWNDWTAW